MATSSAPQQGGATTPGQQQQGQTPSKPAQPGQPTPAKPILGDWASI